MSYAERLGNLAHRVTAGSLMLITCAGLVHVGSGFYEIICRARKFKAEKAALKAKEEEAARTAQQ
eukprot:scaffold83191_cov31-Tisochrysis_lutea.AAC.2